MSTAADPPAPGRRRPIRVAFFIVGRGIGGTELNAVRTAERLDRERIELSVFCHRPEGPLRDRYAAAGIPLHPVPVSSYASLTTVRRIWRVARQLKELGVDVVHTHDRYTNLFGGLAARLAGVRAVIASRRWWDPGPEAVYGPANRQAYRVATRVLANSPALGRLLVEQEGIARRKVVVVPNFVEEHVFEPLPPEQRVQLRRELGIGDDALVIGIVANLHPVKDHVTLVRAFALLRGRLASEALHLVLVGEGKCRSEIEGLVAELGLGDRVHLLGQRPPRPSLHHVFDVSVLCSLNEGSPNSVAEAMAAGRAVVGTSVGGIPDAIDHGVTGLLVPPRDPERLAAALAELLTDPQRRAAMGDRARDVARDRFGVEPVLSRLTALYEELVPPLASRGS